MHATRKDRTAIVLRMLLICMLAAAFFSPAGAVPARAQSGPYIDVYPVDNYIFSGGWSSGVNITLTIDDPFTYPNPDYTQILYSTDGTLDIYPGFNLSQPGIVISLTDGNTSKSFTVQYFQIQLVSYSSGNVSGIGVPDSQINLIYFPDADEAYFTTTVTVDPQGLWEADFSSVGVDKFVWGSFILASITDGAGSTINSSYWVKPFIVARLNANRVLCRGWEPGKLLTLKIDDPDLQGNPNYSITKTVAVDLEHFSLSKYVFNLDSVTTLKPGMVLTLSDGEFTRSMVVAPLTLDVIDPVNDVLSGTAIPNVELYVEVDQLPDGVPSQVMWVDANENGNWSADFSSDFDLNELTEGAVRYFPNENSNDHTRIEFQVEPATVYDYFNTYSGGELALEDGSASITVPPGALTNDTGLVIAPQGTDFQVTTDLGAVQPAVNVNIGPNGTEFEVPVTITLVWSDANNDGIVDGIGFPEANLYVFKDGAKYAGPCFNDNGCDTVNNRYAISVMSLSDFVVGWPNFSISGPQYPLQIGATAQVSTTVENPPAGEYQVSFDWGDGTTSAVYASGSSVSDSHIYAAPGAYSVAATLTREGFDPVTATYNYIVVYDPNGGFVTGGGWFTSPAGAYLVDPSLTGKATFGFVSKYKKGASVPDGNTEFQFKAGALTFHSESYEWLVINKASQRAQYKGQGTVNGALAPNGAAYKFMIWGTDGSPDRFRIKIWWEDSSGERVIYDNGVETGMGGGSIVIHS